MGQYNTISILRMVLSRLPSAMLASYIHLRICMYILHISSLELVIIMFS